MNTNYLMTTITGFFHHLFGGGLTILTIYLTLVLLDLATGYIQAVRSHSWQSSVNFEGLFTKFGALMTIVAAAALDKVGPVLGIQLPVHIALIWTGLLCVYEFGSILENASRLGVKIDWLMQWLAVFEEQVTGDVSAVTDETKGGDGDGEDQSGHRDVDPMV